MGIIGSTIKPFNATAFKAGEDFYDVSEKDIDGKWAVFFFYPADFTFVCPTELEDLGEKYDMLQSMGVEVFAVSTDTHGTTPPTSSGSSRSRSSATRTTFSPTISACCVKAQALPIAPPSWSIRTV